MSTVPAQSFISRPLKSSSRPRLGGRPLQLRDEDLVLRAREVVVALALAVEGADHGLAHGERLGLEALHRSV